MKNLILLLTIVFGFSCNMKDAEYSPKDAVTNNNNNNSNSPVPFTSIVFGINSYYFSNARTVRWNADGSYWVSSTQPDAHGFLVSKYDVNNQYVTGFGASGNGATEMVYPTAMEIDQDGYFYFSDPNMNRIQKYSPAGVHIMSIGDTGVPAQLLNFPRGFDIDNNGNLVISDANQKVMIYSRTGVYVGEFGTNGSNDGQFQTPQDVFVDADGDVYVVDSTRVQKFAAGTYNHMLTINVGSNLENIAVDASKNMYVMVSDPQIKKYDSTGAFVTNIGSFGIGADQYDAVGGELGFTPDGKLTKCDSGRKKINIYTLAGALDKVMAPYGSNNGEFFNPYKTAVDAAGNVYVAEASNYRVQKFDKNGNFLLKFGSQGMGDGQFVQPVGIAVDSTDGSIYVVDAAQHNVQKFDANGGFVYKIGVNGTNDGEFQLPLGIAVASDGFYVAEILGSRVQKFKKDDGSFQMKFGVPGTNDGEFQMPYDIKVDKDGNLIVADTYNHRIQKFLADGTFVLKFGLQGNNPGELNTPSGVGIDSEGNYYVAEAATNRVSKFDKDGVYISTQSSFINNYTLYVPTGLNVDANNNMYISDTMNQRVLRLPTF